MSLKIHFRLFRFNLLVSLVATLMGHLRHFLLEIFVKFAHKAPFGHFWNLSFYDDSTFWTHSQRLKAYLAFTYQESDYRCSLGCFTKVYIRWAIKCWFFRCQIYSVKIFFSHLYFKCLAINWHKGVKYYSPDLFVKFLTELFLTVGGGWI